MPDLSLAEALDETALTRILNLPPRPTPAAVWQQACTTVRALQQAQQPGSLEEQTLGKAYRTLLALDVDGAWCVQLAAGKASG